MRAHACMCRCVCVCVCVGVCATSKSIHSLTFFHDIHDQMIQSQKDNMLNLMPRLV